MRTQTTSTTGPSRAASESPRVVSRDEWLAERKALLAQEKELTHLRDRIAGERRALPWVRIDKDYVFDARSEEHTSELQSLMRISYAVFCLKKKTTKRHIEQTTETPNQPKHMQTHEI